MNDPSVGPRAQRHVQAQCTNWDLYGLTQIWQMVENENGHQSWDQVNAWNKMRSLCEHQATRLRDAASRLEAVWPTGRSEALAE